jgi:hypothetical protein
MAARSGVQYVIDQVRRLSGAGTAEYTVGTITFFSDDEIERILDSRRVRMARYPLTFEETRSGDGSAIYLYAHTGQQWIENVVNGGSSDQFYISDSKGSLIGTASYTLSPEDGFVTFTADQNGSERYITGWIHNPYMGALDVLTAWQTQLAQQPDWATDNMKVSRSQKAKAVADQIDWLKGLAGWAPKIEVAELKRNDLQEGE